MSGPRKEHTVKNIAYLILKMKPADLTTFMAVDDRTIANARKLIRKTRTAADKLRSLQEQPEGL